MIVLDKYNLTVLTIPKCGCTSLKHWAFEVENGFQFRAFTANGRRRAVHFFYKNKTWPERQSELTQRGALDLPTVAILRSPQERFLSAFRNRIFQTEDILKAGAPPGLDAFPSLETFCQNFDSYSEVVSINHHFRPQLDYLPKVDSIDFLFRMEDFGKVNDFLNDRTGREIPFVRTQTSKRSPEGKESALGLAMMAELVEERFSADMDAYSSVPKLA